MTTRFAAIGLLLLPLSVAMSGEVKSWRQSGAADFQRGRLERLVVSDAGRIRLARNIRPAGNLKADRVWDLARDPLGALYASTGDAGQVFRREAGGGDWAPALDTGEGQALSLVATADGRVFVGTGPGGRVIEVTNPEHPETRPDPSVQYIWDLACDAEGNLIAATGPEGGLWKRPADGGDWVRILDSPHPHLLSVAVGPEGSIYAGSDGGGLIYRVGVDGAVSVLHDAPQEEIRTLAIGPDGTLHAGTAQAAGDRGRTSRLMTPLPGQPSFRRVSGDGGSRLLASYQEGGTARPSETKAGENVVYRIDPDGAAREVFRAEALIFALAFQEDRLLIGTGPAGRLYEIRGGGRESTPLARLDSGAILALLSLPDGSVLLGTGDPGAVSLLEPTYRVEGSLVSDVLDAKLASRFGALTWEAEEPEGTSVSVQVRTGNAGEPDATWSDWSLPRSDPASAGAEVPEGRFAQYRLTLRTDDPTVTPEVRSVTLRYQTVNLAPEIASIDVPDIRESDGATRRTNLAIAWKASDPNGDTLSFRLRLRKDGWPDWIPLGGAAPLTGSSYDWDTTSVPAGRYQVRVTATDRPSNPPDEALERSLTSEPFLVDHEAPRVAVSWEDGAALVRLEDNLTRLVKAAYALDGGEWTPVFPIDGLFDRSEESLRIELPDPKPGTHVLMVRATDAAGNVGAGDLVFEVK